MTPPWARLARWADAVSVVMLSALWLVFTRRAIAVPALVVFAILLGAAALATPRVALARWARGVVSVVTLSVLWLVFTRKGMGIAVPAFVVFATLLGAAALGMPRRSARAAFAVFLFASLSPVDVTLRNVDGPPRIVPYGMGLPTPATLERAKRGDVVLGGCVVTGFEPLWVVVW